ncbi:MAG: efflux RND transporter permease subunit [Eubacteriales bacterium]
MFLTKIALNRPVSVILFLFTIIVFGISAIFGFQMGYQPAVEMPTFLVVTPYVGAEPEIIDSTISAEVEKIGATLTGFTESTCMSEEGLSTVIFMFDYDIDKNQTYLDLKTAVDQLVLPEDAMDPVIMQFAFESTSMMTLSVTGDEGEDPLSFTDDVVVPQIETLMGVADVEVYGGQEDYIRVVADPVLMEQYGISLQSIGSAIAMFDFDLPLGSLPQGLQDLSVSSGASLDNLAQIQDISMTTGTGALISLKEVAQVQIGAKDAESVSRYDGIENINVEIINAQDANIPAVAADIYKALDLIRANNPNFNIEVTDDSSDLIVSTLISVMQTLAIAVVLCMLVLYIFLGNIRASLIVGSAIPISLVVTLICMSVAGFELNMVTSNALMIAIGLMVDNAIVVLESIFKIKNRVQAENLSVKEQFKVVAYDGCRVVGASVVASTITTIVVYLPLTTLGGVSGQMFVQLSYTIVFAMIASLLSATVLVPMFYFLLQPEEKRSMVSNLMEKMEKGYVKIVPSVLKHRFLVVVFSIALLAGSLALCLVIPLELMPESDTGKLIINVDFRSNSKLEEMSSLVEPIEAIVMEDERIESYQLAISGNSATITCFAVEGQGAKPLVNEYLEKTYDMTDMSISISASGDEMMESMVGDMTLILTTLHGYDYDALQVAALDFEEKLYELEGVQRVTSSLGTWGSAKASIKIDPNKTMDYGTNPVNVAQTLRLAVTGYEHGEMDIGLDTYDLVVEYPAGYADDLHLLMNMPIDTAVGKVPLSQMAELVFSDNMQSIKKMNGYYCIDLTTSPVTGGNAQVSAAIAELEASVDYGSEIFVGNGPGVDYITDEVVAMGQSIITAVFLVFMVMAMQFESLRFSLMVMCSVSFSFIGSFGLLFLSGQPITIVALMGILMLMGIVVNNGILFVDTANQYRKTCDTLEEALILSGQVRMRPIIMTTLTTVLSMLPLAFGVGEGADMMQSMGIIIIGGLIASTVLVLFLMPTFYLIISKKTPPTSPSKPEKIEAIV